MNILFICTGNICRSPLAEKVLINKLNKAEIDDVTVKSAGTFACKGSAMSQGSVRALKAMGISDTSHIAVQADQKLIKDADLILTMTREHKNYFIGFDNVYSIGEYCDMNDIADPYGMPQEYYDITARDIDKACEIILNKIKEVKKI